MPVVVPSLEPYGLHLVPHYQGDESWRKEWMAWRDEVIVLRDRVQTLAFKDPSFRAEELRICAEDPAYFASMYMWIEEPRVRAGEDVVKPLVQFPFQVQLIQHFAAVAADPEAKDIFISKARGLGASWTVVQFAVWAWLFRPWRGRMVSRKEDLVDKPLDLDSLFGKIDFILRWLPRWMIPEGFDREKHRQKNMLSNPRSKAQITGESTSSKTGRGGRSTYIVYDEAAFIPGFDDVFGTGAGTTDHRFAVSSESFEEGEAWYRAWTRAKAENPTLVWELDYWLNPYFDAEWYAAEEKRWGHDPEGFKREYLRDPYAGFGAWIYPAARELPIVDQPYDPSQMLLVAIDPGHMDDTAVVWGQPRVDPLTGNRGIHWLGCYERNLMPVEWYAHLLTGIPPEPGDECFGMPISRRDEELMAFFRSLPWTGDRVRFYMDPAGAQKHSGISFWDLFVKKTHALRKRVAGDGRKPQAIAPFYRALQGQARLHDERRNATRRLLPFSTFNDNADGRRIREALANYRFSDMTEKATSEAKPIHNQHSHVTTAVEYASVYFALGLADPPKPRVAAAKKPKKLTAPPRRPVLVG